MSFLYAVQSSHCDKIHFVRCYSFKKQGCNIEHSKNNNKTGSRRCSCPMSDAYQAKNCSSVTSVADPGCLSRIPDPDFYPTRIPDPGSRISDPGSRIQKQQQKRGEKN
jgi:hypothetical protein